MKITNISFKNNNYILKIDNKDYQIDDFYYKVLYPYIGKQIDNATLYTINCFNKANEKLKKLYKKIYAHTISTKEFYSFLMDVCDYGERKEIVHTFKNEGYLDDEKVINYYLNKFQEDKGVIYFKKKMQEIGIDAQLIDKYSYEYQENIEYAMSIANKIINSKQTSTNLIKQSIFASLANKGFSSKTINDVLLKVQFKDDFKSLKKDYDKIKGKYQTQKIISKLLNKGYNISSIKKVVKEDFDYEDI